MTNVVTECFSILHILSLKATLIYTAQPLIGAISGFDEECCKLIMQSDDVDSIFFKHHSIEYELA
jgi:hypothetical protein